MLARRSWEEAAPMLRRSATAAGLVVAVASSVALATTIPHHSHHGNNHARAHRILLSLADPAVRRADGFPAGRLVSATVCVHGSCAHKVFHAAPTCSADAACIGTALIARRLPHDVTVTVELG
jgi:hypothetical protein